MWCILVNIKIRDWNLSLDEDSTPNEILIEISTRCNLKCLHCFRFSSRTLRPRDMDLDTFKAILDNAAKSKVRKIVFTGWGEPTINPHVVDMLELAKSNGFYIVLNTNGQLLGEIANELVKQGVDEVYVSLDAVDAELYAKIREKGELPIITKGVLELNDIKRKTRADKPILSSIFTINKLNVDQIERIVKYVADIGIQNLYLSFYIPHLSGDTSIDCLNNQECLSRFKQKIDELSITLVNTPIKLWLPSIESYTARECLFAYNKALYVRVDGKITPCLFLAYSWSIVLDNIPRRIDEHVIGDAISEDLKNVWHRNYKMYFKLLFNHMPSCLDCNLRKWCSYTLDTETDCYGNSPNCSFCPYHYKFSYCPL